MPGFRQNNSCEKHAVSHLSQLETMNNGFKTNVMAMDLCKAFDTVPHNRLIEKRFEFSFIIL